MELYKVFIQLHIIALLLALCAAETETSTDEPALLKLLKPRDDSAEEDLREEDVDSYTPSSIFPSDETQYSTNETLIQQLLTLNSNSSEVDDLIHSGIKLQGDEQQYDIQNTTANDTDENTNERNGDKTNEVQNTSSNEDDYVSDLDDENTGDNTELPKLETEWIENGENTEDDRGNVSLEVINETVNSSTVHYTIRSDYFGIFSGFLIIIGVIMYLTLSAWRRMMQQRYIEREMLVNEDDFYDRNDMKHFSI